MIEANLSILIVDDEAEVREIIHHYLKKYCKKIEEAADGGIMRYNLGGYSDGGRMLKGPGDGMSDSIPATIAGKQPARLADGEFVIPADVVSALGNGSTKAGSDKLYEMMHEIRKRARSTKVKDLPPPAKSPLQYLKGRR
jgi:hypothetical protein